MSAASAIDGAVTPAAVPIVFDAAGGWCRGWYHAPTGAARDLVVVMCPPLVIKDEHMDQLVDAVAAAAA